MKKKIFKARLLVVSIVAGLISTQAFAIGKPYESDYSNQIYGFKPIIESVGAVIIKNGDKNPYAASKHSDQATRPQVGDTLYVPVDVLASVLNNADYAGAYSKDIYSFADKDSDIEAPKKMALKVEWYVFNADDTRTDFSGLTPIASGIESTGYGVPYIIKPSDLGKKIGFKITPMTERGLPKEGNALSVVDISKLAGQVYPIDKDGNPDPSFEPKDNDDKKATDNPNIDTGIVGGSGNIYEVYVYNSQGERIDGSAGAKVYVNNEYRVEVWKLDTENNTYVDITNTPEVKNNIMWELYTVGDTGHQKVVSSGISADAMGDLDALRADENYNAMTAPGSDITGRLNDGTLTFTTQETNASALYTGEPNFSEQGLQIKAVYIADEAE